MINKRRISLPVVYSRPFASKAVFWTILEWIWVRRWLFFIKDSQRRTQIHSRIVQKTAFEAKGRLYTTGKEIRRLFIIDLHTRLAIYGYRWGKL